MSKIESLPLVLALLAWPVLGIGMALFRKRAPGAAARRDPVSLVGLLVQALAFALAFALRRSLDPNPPPWEVAVRWLGTGLAWISVGVVIAAVRTLGRQWSLEARVLEGHRLVEEGPYRYVRHPIYAAMLGLCVGTAVNLTPWAAIPVATAFYLGGTRLRTRAEESLLTRELGEAYRRYAAAVPALVPRLTGRRLPPTGKS